MAKSTTDDIGDLLARAGLITDKELEHSLPLANKTGVPVGRILVESGAIRSSVLQAGVFAQSMIRDNVLHADLAAKALKLVALHDLSFDEALKQLGWRSDFAGDLLVKAGLITEREVAHALPLANKTGLSVGRVLVDSGVVSNNAVKASIHAESLIRDNLLHADLAVKALKLVGENDLSLDEALGQLGWHSEYYERTNTLGKLLMHAGFVTEEQLTLALEVCFGSGLPLGRVLVLRQVITEAIAYAALSALIMIQENGLTKDQAVRFMKSLAGESFSVQDFRGIFNIVGEKNSKSVRLGELLISAELVATIDLLSAIENSIVRNKPIGHILVDGNLISDETLNHALELQNRVNAGQLNLPEAERLLKQGTSIDALTGQILPRSLDEMELDELLSAVGLSGEAELPKLVRELVLQKENLSQKIVHQQEEMKNDVARELHDTIIADLMMLKRYLAGDKALSPQEIMEIVDHVIRQLRDICQDFAPRQLQHAGLKATLEDLLNRMRQRTGIDASFSCSVDLPSFPETVKLHLFRIVQEALNNVEKYSGASKVSVEILRTDDGLLKFEIKDNGRGFSLSESGAYRAGGGMGMGSMHERAHLVHCFYPTRLTVDSEQGGGSTVTVQMTVDIGNW